MLNEHSRRRIYIFDVNRWVCDVLPNIKDLKPFNELKVPGSLLRLARHGQKNWAPLVYGRETFFVYNHIDPIALVQCAMETGCCTFPTGHHDSFRDIANMRGGTPYIPFSTTANGAYYVAFTYYHNPFQDSYRPVLAVAFVAVLQASSGFGSANQSIRRGYRRDDCGVERHRALNSFDLNVAPVKMCGSSNHLKSHPSAATVGIVKPIYYSQNIEFPDYSPRILIPVSIARWDLVSDFMELVLNVEDDTSPVYAVRGVAAHVKKVISAYEAALV